MPGNLSANGQPSYRQIRVGQYTVGVNGLDEIFSALHTQGCEPNTGLIPRLLTYTRQYNHIPENAEDIYAQALLQEYHRFFQQQAAGCPSNVDYGTWRGYAREIIPWYPGINAGRCDGCGACLHFCPSTVFARADDDRVQVIEPFRCQVGCSACLQICKRNAIIFPPREILEAFTRR